MLLIDELDRADEEFEAFLLELLSDFQITRARARPRIRAEKPPGRDPYIQPDPGGPRRPPRRRCLYHWIDYPSFDKEYAIVTARVPEAADSLTRQVVGFVQALREEDLYKRPGVAETLDWVAALQTLDQEVLGAEVVEATLGALLKYQDDIEHVRGETVERIVDGLPKAS